MASSARKTMTLRLEGSLTPDDLLHVSSVRRLGGQLRQTIQGGVETSGERDTRNFAYCGLRVT